MTSNADYETGDWVDFTLAFACEYCRAAAGHPCRTKSGRIARTHAPRWIWLDDALPPNDGKEARQ